MATYKMLLDLRRGKFEVKNIGRESSGNIKDVFHPQARFANIGLYHEENYAGAYIKEAEKAADLIPHLWVEGYRPRPLNIGVKHFQVAVFAKAEPAGFIFNHEDKRKLLENLASYLMISR